MDCCSLPVRLIFGPEKSGQPGETQRRNFRPGNGDGCGLGQLPVVGLQVAGDLLAFKSDSLVGHVDGIDHDQHLDRVGLRRKGAEALNGLCRPVVQDREATLGEPCDRLTVIAGRDHNVQGDRCLAVGCLGGLLTAQSRYTDSKTKGSGEGSRPRRHTNKTLQPAPKWQHLRIFFSRSMYAFPTERLRSLCGQGGRPDSRHLLVLSLVLRLQYELNTRVLQQGRE